MGKRISIAGVVALAAIGLIAPFGRAAVMYNTAGSTYAEGFDAFPLDMPNNASIETVYTDGWQDDVNAATSPENDVSVLGWHLRHPIAPASENGFNGNQRLRAGPGANTGAFWAFSTGTSTTDAEKALGDVGSTTTAANGENLYIALQLINNTGETLTEFTVTYDGEQYRDGQATTGETLGFDYSLNATDADWWDVAPTYTAVPELNFTAPVTAGTGTSGTAVNGNAEGRIGDITATISGINWAPGGELWLRWGDPQLASAADDGLAIDNVRFTAVVPEPASLGMLALAAAGLLRRRHR